MSIIKTLFILYVFIILQQVIGAMYKLYWAKGDAEILNQSRKNIAEGLQPFEEELNKRGTPFFGGDRPGMLDYMIWPWVERLPVLAIMSQGLVDIPKEKLPNFVSNLNWQLCLLIVLLWIFIKLADEVDWGYDPGWCGQGELHLGRKSRQIPPKSSCRQSRLRYGVVDAAICVICKSYSVVICIFCSLVYTLNR